MKVIYVTPLWTGIEKFFLNGENNVSGMPAFFEVFKRMLNNKRIDKIYILLFSTNNKFKIPEEYDDKLVIINFNHNKYLKPFVYISALVSIIKICKHNKIEFVYGHGPVSFLAGLSSRFTNTKAYHRVYGTFFIKEIQKPNFILFLKYPFAYLSYAVKNNGLIITNDGTRADVVYNKIGNKKTPLYFLINGIEKDPEISDVPEWFSKLKIDNYISYIARIDKWKRQHVFIDIINKAKQKGYPINALIIGQPYDKVYCNDIENKINKLELSNQIKIIKGISSSEKNYILKNSICSLSLYEISNLGNVFLESLSLGVPMIAFNVNNCFEKIDSTSFISIYNENEDDVVDSLIKLYTNLHYRKYISDQAKEFAHNKLLSWNQRVNIEFEILGLI